MVLKGGLELTLFGLATGALAAIPCTRVVAATVAGARANDFATWVAAPLLLFAAAMLACWVPARRAAAMDPLAALGDG